MTRWPLIQIYEPLGATLAQFTTDAQRTRHYDEWFCVAISPIPFYVPFSICCPSNVCSFLVTWLENIPWTVRWVWPAFRDGFSPVSKNKSNIIGVRMSKMHSIHVWNCERKNINWIRVTYSMSNMCPEPKIPHRWPPASLTDPSHHLLPQMILQGIMGLAHNHTWDWKYAL